MQLLYIIKRFFENAKNLTNTLRYTWSHLYKSIKTTSLKNSSYFDGTSNIVTLQYPHEKLEVPERGRYKLQNVIDDCIVCDKCAKVCPVDCIEIESIPAPDIIGITSNGMKKRLYAAKFDIDMAKCCFCGLCTTVCPTECLTMTPTYDFSVFDIKEHKFSFAEMDEPQIAQKNKYGNNIWLIHNRKLTFQI